MVRMRGIVTLQSDFISRNFKYLTFTGFNAEQNAKIKFAQLRLYYRT